jgi:hypothetical protein
MGERPGGLAAGHMPYLMDYPANPRPVRSAIGRRGHDLTVSEDLISFSNRLRGRGDGAGIRPLGRYVPQPDEMAVTSLDQ